MTFHVKDGGTWKAPVSSGVSVKDAGTWKTVDEIWAKKDNTWIKFYPTYDAPGPPDTSVTASASPTTATGTRTGTGTVTTNTVTISASGGSGPYTYLWTRLSGDVFNISAPTAATTSFNASVTAGSTLTASYQCTIRDGAGRSTTVTVSVTASATVSPLAASRSPATLSTTISGAGTATTASCSVTASGGSGSYTYLWTIQDGSFTINSPNTASTSFSKPLSNGQIASGDAYCTVTDSAGATVQTLTVHLEFESIDNIPDLSASRTPATLTKTGIYVSGTLTLTTTACVASPSGGVATYTYLWTRVSGSSSINITSATSASTTFSSAFTGGGQLRSAVFKCTIQDSAGQTADTATVSVTIQSLLALSASASPTSNTKSSSFDPVISDGYNCISSGGVAPHEYLWERVSGSTAITIGNPTNSVTSFLWNSLGTPGTVSANFRCKVIDDAGTIVYSNSVVVQLTRTA